MKAEPWVIRLQPDDLCIVHHGGYSGRRSIGRVTKASKTGQVTVTVSGHREYIFLPSGWQRGGGSYTKAYIRPYDPQEAQKIKDENEHEKLAGKLGSMSWRDWQEIPLSVVREVWKLVAENAEGEKK